MKGGGQKRISPPRLKKFGGDGFAPPPEPSGIKASKVSLRRPDFKRVDQARLGSGELSQWARSEITRRLAILRKYDRLRALGMEGTQAAWQAGASRVSIWRWKRRLIPVTFACGRRSLFSICDVPQPVLQRVRKLQVAGKTNRQAWRQVAGERICPSGIAELMAWLPEVPQSFLQATRLKKRTIDIVERKSVQIYAGHDFLEVSSKVAPQKKH